MPEKETMARAKRDAREGKSTSTQAGEFVREEMHHVREGNHGAKSTKQAIAIGLSKARRAGVKLSPPAKGKTSARVRTQAQRDAAKGQAGARSKPSTTRSRATRKALKRQGTQAASAGALSLQARRSTRARGPAARKHAAMKSAATRRGRQAGKAAR